ncbi:hypothetical protein DLAC_10073 [Tieghemostelium lacteum]|uniref:Uncharacterized protein n=1 Tax=Tieghemostelium lacteum TaxID=361077 RepID=A0A151Z627_TIELA|nr:hypothetical protein DLAC_10073 [Tieghemostelium lacteum]|eukprot:KYQ89412.1 hypothetical protein DLAC_10073 [Tieghemostelium lacteum]
MDGLKSMAFDKGVEVVQDVLGLGGQTNNNNPNDRAPSDHRQNARDQETMNKIRESQNAQVEEGYYNSNSNDGVLVDDSNNNQSYQPAQGYYQDN